MIQKILEIAQIARERVKDEAFHKDDDTGKNSLDLTHTREIITDAIISAFIQDIDETIESLPLEQTHSIEHDGFSHPHETDFDRGRNSYRKDILSHLEAKKKQLLELSK